MRYDVEMLLGFAEDDSAVLLGTREASNRAQQQLETILGLSSALRPRVKQNPEILKLYDELLKRFAALDTVRRAQISILSERLLDVLWQDDEHKLAAATALSRDDIDTIHRLRKLQALSEL